MTATEGQILAALFHYLTSAGYLPNSIKQLAHIANVDEKVMAEAWPSMRHGAEVKRSDDPSRLTINI